MTAIAVTASKRPKPVTFSDLTVGTMFTVPNEGGLFMKVVDSQGNTSAAIIQPLEHAGSSSKGRLSAWLGNSVVIPYHSASIRVEE